MRYATVVLGNRLRIPPASIFPNMLASESMPTVARKCPVWRSLVAAAALFCAGNPTGNAQSRDDADAAFRRGMTALHNFEYEDANEAFSLARRRDPGFALAYWGEAMTYHQALWRRENLE